MESSISVHQQQSLDNHVKRIEALVARFISKHDKKEVSLYFKANDRTRLLNLFIWSQRYKVGEREILEILVPYWRKAFPSRKITQGLGVSLPTLFGKKSKDILITELKKRYPDEENINRWKCERRENTMNRAPVVYEDVFALMDSYRDDIKKAREETKKVYKKLSRRNFRDNPWR